MPPLITSNASVAEKALLHAFQTLEVEGIGPGLVANLVKAGIHTFPALLDATESVLKEAIGPGRGVTTRELLKKRVSEASICTLMVASNLLPRGVGERKLRPLFALDPSPRRWTMREVEGWSKETLEGLFAVLPKVIAWCESVKPEFASAIAHAPIPAATAPAAAPAPHKTVVFTGCRPDKAIQDQMTRSGWVMVDSVTKKTNLLVHGDATDSVKIRKARNDGIQVCDMAHFTSLL